MIFFLFFLFLFGFCLSCSQDILHFHSINIFTREELTKEESFLSQRTKQVRSKLCKTQNRLATYYLSIFSTNNGGFDEMLTFLTKFIKTGLNTENLSQLKRKIAIEEIKSIKIIIEDLILLVASLEYVRLSVKDETINTLMRSIAGLVGKMSYCRHTALEVNFYRFDPRIENFKVLPPSDLKPTFDRKSMFACN